MTIEIKTRPKITRNHLAFLDGLRGVAAGAVFVFHLFSSNGFHLFSYSPLAVDFFFILSGYVIALAYEAKLQSRMTRGAFVRLRFNRLYPMIFAGMVLGLLITAVRSATVGDISSYQVFQVATSSVLLLPSYALPQYMEAFPGNAPMWSLFFEVIANVVYALLLAKARDAILYLVIALSGVALLAVAWQLGSILHGFDKQYLYVGLLRVAFSFPVGVLIYRRRGLIPRFMSTAPPVAAALPVATALIAILFWPGEQYAALELGMVFIAFPTILALASRIEVSGRLSRLCLILGAFSYPLYAIHAPIIRVGVVFGKRFESISPEVLVGCEFCAALAVTWVLMKFYDEPVRRWLARRTITSENSIVLLRSTVQKIPVRTE